MQYRQKQKKWISQNVKDSNTLLSFTYPQKVIHGYYNRRKFRITIKYLNKDKKQKYKTIYFGLIGIPNKIDGNQSKRKKKVSMDMFSPRFWEQKLLNSKTTIKQAFLDAVDELIGDKVVDLDSLKIKNS